MSAHLNSALQQAALLLENGAVEEAFLAYSELFTKNPSDQIVCVAFAKSLCKKGDPDQAIHVIDEFLKNFPNSSTFADLYFIKGFALETAGKLQEACKNYETCIYFDPKHFDALYNQGNIFLELCNYSQALSRYEIAINIDPVHAKLLNNAGIASVQSGQIVRGIDYFEQSVKASPRFVEGLANLGWTELNEGQAALALERFKTLLAIGEAENLKPIVIDACKGCALAQVELGQFSEALQSLNRAVEIDPNNPELLNNRGNVFKYLDQCDSAIADLNQALALNAGYAQAHSNLGNVYKELGDFDQALKEYQLAIDLQPGFAQAHLNKALLLLGRGEFESGFQNYEWRWATKEYSKHVLQTTKPLWDLAQLKSSQTLRLLVWNEQGVGDDVYFVRFLRILKFYIENLIVRIDPRLESLLSPSFPGVRFVSEDKPIPDEDFDAHIPLGSLARLGHLLMPEKSGYTENKGVIEEGVGANSIAPSSTYYLKCDSKKVSNSRRSLSARLQRIAKQDAHSEFENNLVIGVSWKSLHPQSGAKRSLSLTDLIKGLGSGNGAPDDSNANGRPLKMKGISWVSLQYSDVSNEIENAALTTGSDIHEVAHLDVERDLSELANLMCSCDLVISIDNTTAHLAAALGVKTWVLLPFTSDWRWQVVKDPVYGYASAETFRQKKLHQWDEPIAQMALKLRELLLKN